MPVSYKKKNMKKSSKFQKLSKNIKRNTKTRHKLRKMKGGGIIDDLIELTNDKKIIEDPADITIIDCSNGNIKNMCKECKFCKSRTYTSGYDIFHIYTCKYFKGSQNSLIQKGVRNIATTSIDNLISIGIIQREYGIINNNTSKKIIGTYGAGSCVILSMRNRNTNNTILAHIDANTDNPLQPFLQFPNDNCDVYIIGGDSTSKALLNNILKILKKNKFEITFAHIIDDNSNSFAINCITGATYLNNELKINDFPPADERLRNFEMFAQLKQSLSKLNIL